MTNQIAQAKPILLIKIYDGLINRDWEGFREAMDLKFNDYHVLVIPAEPTMGVLELEVFNNDSITPIEINELKQIILDATDRNREVNKGVL